MDIGMFPNNGSRWEVHGLEISFIPSGILHFAAIWSKDK